MSTGEGKNTGKKTINVNFAGQNARREAKGVIDLSSSLKPAAGTGKKKTKKIKNKTVSYTAEPAKPKSKNPKVKSVNADLGLVHQEKKLIMTAGVTFFMALVIVFWAFNMEKIYDAEGSGNTEPLIEAEDLEELNRKLDERMAEVKNELKELSSMEEASLPAVEGFVEDAGLGQIPDEQGTSSPEMAEIKSIDLKKIINEIKSMKATETPEVSG